MLNFADIDGAEGKTVKEEKVDEPRLEQCPNAPSEPCVCAEEVKFFTQRIRRRKSEGILSSLDKIKKLPNTRLWKLYEKLKGSERPRLCAVVREIIYERYLPDVLSVAKSYSRRKLPAKSLARPEDITQAAIMAHLEGIDLYSPDFGTTYMQFLNASGNKSRVRGRIIDALRKLQHLPRDISRKRRDWKERIEMLSHQLGKHPTMEELHEAYGDEAEEVYSDPLFDTIVVNQIDDDDGDTVSIEEFDETKKVSKKSFVETKDHSPARDAILSLISSQKVKFVIDAYYFGRMLCTDIANRLDCSTSTVSTLRRRGERIILSKMTQQEFEALFK
jgi:RNA polymerase sigma factor (sigma-70 family)